MSRIIMLRSIKALLLKPMPTNATAPMQIQPRVSFNYVNKQKLPYQAYSHRTDLGCGSTIGPTLAAQLGMPTVDIGNPMWAMHSIRESAGAIDHGYMIDVLKQHFQS